MPRLAAEADYPLKPAACLARASLHRIPDSSAKTAIPLQASALLACRLFRLLANPAGARRGLPKVLTGARLLCLSI